MQTLMKGKERDQLETWLHTEMDVQFEVYRQVVRSIHREKDTHKMQNV